MKVFSAMFAVVCLIGTSFSVNKEGQSTSPIVVNQMGYRPHDAKVAFLKERAGNEYRIVDDETGKTVFRGKIHPIGTTDKNTGEVLFAVDFSRLKRPGMYRVTMDDTLQSSQPFSIALDVYNRASLAALKSFYYQRCGIAIEDGTPWGHPKCHMRYAHYFSELRSVKDVQGGWHDAGDYNRFLPTTAVSIAFLLYLYEKWPEKFHDGQTGIPEGKNGVPDLLDEARWGLEWVMKMQETNGGIAHKVSIKRWTGEHLPHKEEDAQYLFPVSSAATAAGAAVAALGARLFLPYDKDFSRKLLQTSLKAWDFLEANPSIVPEGGFRNPEGVEGGEYGDVRDIDERLWASVELLKTTGNSAYRDYFLRHYKELGGVNYAVSWQNVQNFAYFTFLTLPATAEHYQARSFIISTLTTYCDALLKRVNDGGYRYVLLPEQQYWGSNSVAMGHAYDLIMAYETTKHRRYHDAALDQLHYMLGRNTFDLSFITGVGENAVRHPYHQASMLIDDAPPVPGMLVAGCNAGSRLKGQTISPFPGRNYEDNEKNYFVNEPAINYTASFLFVASYFSVPSETAATDQMYSEEVKP